MIHALLQQVVRRLLWLALLRFRPNVDHYRAKCSHRAVVGVLRWLPGSAVGSTVESVGQRVKEFVGETIETLKTGVNNAGQTGVREKL
ncbi:hypothetical protein HaLaN_02381 [Haematococcus lacustris]|uniref:Uncharacterized protein n=1 Tax=Haematococcus lacustris TaxID=44745 RepID=A0A699YX23_HAELA|nr:hypothetical protein HaLaN_02381 [Haematococcus lacustris]